MSGKHLPFTVPCVPLVSVLKTELDVTVVEAKMGTSTSTTAMVSAASTWSPLHVCMTYDPDSRQACWGARGHAARVSGYEFNIMITPWASGVVRIRQRLGDNHAMRVQARRGLRIGEGLVRPVRLTAKRHLVLNQSSQFRLMPT
jgi:hypothetical protein